MSITKNIVLLLTVILFIVTLSVRKIGLETSYNSDSLASIDEMNALDSQLAFNYFTLHNITNFKQIGAKKLAHDLEHTMPAYFTILKIYQTLTRNTDDTNLRFLSTLFSAAISPLIFFFALSAFGFWGACLATLTTLLSPLLQYHGSYIRFYACLAFFSLLSHYLCYSFYLKVKSNSITTRSRTLHILLCALLLWIPVAIHATGALIVFICLYTLVFFVWPELQRKEKKLLLTTTALSGIIFFGNTLAHITARFIDTAAVNNVMSESAASFFASLFFNFGGPIFIVIAAALISKKITKESFRLLYLPYSICLILLFVAVLYRNDLFRPDYLISILPLTYILFADATIRLTNSKITQSVLVAACLCFSFPSFISNALLDQDRLNYAEALKVVEQNSKGKTLIYSVTQTNFKKYPSAKNFTFANLQKVGELDETTYDEVYYLLGWKRQGFSKKFLSHPKLNTLYPKILATSRLLSITGKNRLDAKDNLFFIFKKEPHSN